MGTTVLIPKTTHVEFDIPQNLVGKELEITYKEVDVIRPKNKAKFGDFLGILSEKSGEAIKAEIAIMREEWDRDI